ncbi:MULTISPECIES: P-loop NTPase [Halorubrum]|uniref:Cobyrinic acid ac-diamide synthase n=1 Tax=Halorubrum hochstenium ATCC 700873 TaxID=1227481 RepID=M0FJ52_9EURY|nr:MULTISPECIES: P-loop NTPase [Halorubrum]ELZ58609.1 cobyrinic acid ac-diamide synthase [Halorubrum hochstenium ATCC 700873]
MATVYAVASAKGGVGKTTTTAALATILAESGADVVAIDADLGMANLASAVGVTPGETTVHDVLAGEAEPAAAVREGPSGLRVVPGATHLDAYAAADPSGLRQVVEAFDDADFVFVDAGAGLSHDSTLPLAIADETLLVSTPERSALGDTEKTRQLTERLGGTVAGAAITRVTDDTDEVVTALLDAPVLGRIPDDEAVGRAAAANRPLSAVAADAPATRAYRDLARALTGVDVAGAGLDGPAAEAASGARSGDGVDDGDGSGIDGESGDGDGSDDDEERAVEDETADETDATDGDADDDGPVTDDAVIVDDEPEPAAGDEGGEPSEGDEGTPAPDDDRPADEDDIIVADPDATGVTEPGDGDDIIVASEDEADADAVDDDVTDAGDAEAAGAGHAEAAEAESADADPTNAESADVEPTDADEATDTGRDEDDAESVTEDRGSVGDEDAETGADAGTETGEDDDSDAIPDADETARATAAERTESDDDIEDELAGSIPFRDDDTGTMNTVLSEEAEGGDDPDGSADDDGDGTTADDDEDDGDGEDGGFFSRLLGR